MQTSLRLLGAAVVASTAAAVEAESVTHPCYAGYDCLEYKVTNALDVHIDEFDEARKDWLDEVYDTREGLIATIKELRVELQQASRDRAAASISVLADAVEASLASLDETLSAIKQNIRGEKTATARRVRSAGWDTIDEIKAIVGDADEQAGYPYGGPTYGRGARAVSRRLYAQVETAPESPHFLDSERAEGVNELVDGYQATLDAEAAHFADLIERCNVILANAIQAEKDAYATARAAERDAFNQGAAEDGAELDELRAEQLATLDGVIAEKVARMEGDIERLRGEYIQEFMSTLFEIHEQAQSYQTVLLTAKAEEKRSGFFATLNDTQILLNRGLANTRANFVDQSANEWDRLEGTQNYARAQLAMESSTLQSILNEGADADTAELDAYNEEVAAWLDERLLLVGHEIEQFVSGVDGYTNHYPFVPRGYTAPAKQIYGYAGHDVNEIGWIDGQSATFNDEIMSNFNAETDLEMFTRQMQKDMIVAVGTNSNTAAIDELCLVTDNLINYIENENDAAMTMLTEVYDACTDSQTGQRGAIEQSIEDLKAEILAELQGLLDALYAKKGWRSSRMPLWQRIRELTEVYHQAEEQAQADFAVMQSSTKAVWDEESAEADAAYAAVLAQKEEDWQAASEVAAAAWAAALAKAQADWYAALEASEAKIAEYIQVKERALEVKYNALSETVTHIYDFHLQHTTQVTLDAARDEAAAECAARYAELDAVAQDIQQCVSDAAAEQSSRHADAQEEKEAQCDAAVEEQGALWDMYFEDITGDFTTFQAENLTGFSGKIADWGVKFHEGVGLIKRGMFGYGRYSHW